jgi:hypothetical protein
MALNIKLLVKAHRCQHISFEHLCFFCPSNRKERKAKATQHIIVFSFVKLRHSKVSIVKTHRMRKVRFDCENIICLFFD